MSDISVTINAKLDVDRKTAEICLRLVEIFVNGNNVNVIVDRQDNGELSFRYDYQKGYADD